MPAATVTPTLRWADLLCGPCQTAIIADGWYIDIPLGADVNDLFYMDALDRSCRACDSCRPAVATHIDTGGEIKGFHRRRGLDRIMYTTIHEAAHTRVAQVLGANVVRVELTCDSAGRPKPDGAGLTIIDDIHRLPADAAMPIYWSGQQANLQWLAEQGLDTDADRLDTRETGSGDLHLAVGLIKHYHPTADVDTLLAHGRAHADQLVKQHWSEILDLAQRLAVEGAIDF